MCPGARVAALSSVLKYLAQEKLSALVLRIFEELLGLIILDDLVRAICFRGWRPEYNGQPQKQSR